MRGRIAEHGGDRVRGREQRHQPALDLGERLVPADRDERAVALDQRRAQPIGIAVQLAERRALGAQEARAQHVGIVTADPDDAIAVDRDVEPAAGLAQWADPMRHPRS